MLSRRQQPAVRSLTSSRRTSSRQLHWRSQWRLQPPLLKSSLYAAETSNVSPGKNLKAQRQEPVRPTLGWINRQRHKRDDKQKVEATRALRATSMHIPRPLIPPPLKQWKSQQDQVTTRIFIHNLTEALEEAHRKALVLEEHIINAKARIEENELKRELWRREQAQARRTAAGQRIIMTLETRRKAAQMAQEEAELAQKEAARQSAAQKEAARQEMARQEAARWRAYRADRLRAALRQEAAQKEEAPLEAARSAEEARKEEARQEGARLASDGLIEAQPEPTRAGETVTQKRELTIFEEISEAWSRASTDTRPISGNTSVPESSLNDEPFQDGGRKLTYPKKRAASLYEELFGSGSQKSKMSKPLGSLGQERIEDHREDRRQHLEEASIFQDSELSAYVDSNVASDQRRDPPTTPALGLSPAPQRTCLRLFSLSKSLLVSDFARLANQGNLDGWSSNLINVMQVRSPITQEPEGEYFLIFNSPTAARAYAESLEKLHETAYDAATERLKSLTRLPAKQALGSNDVNQGSGSGGVEAEATAEESSDRDQGQDQDRDASESSSPSLPHHFTVLPPKSSLASLLDYQLCQALPMRKLLDTRQNRDATEDKSIGEIFQSKQGEHLPRPRDRKRLVTLLSGPAHFTGDPNRVLVKLHGSKITALDLRAAIDADGRARNLAWKLSNQSWSPSETEEEEEEGEDFNGGGDAPHLQAEEAGAKARRSARKRKWEEEKIRMIHPLPYSESLKMYKDEDGEARDPIKKRFGAFVVSFADHVESKRFVRVWHKRELADKTRDMTMTVHASSLW